MKIIELNVLGKWAYLILLESTKLFSIFLFFFFGMPEYFLIKLQEKLK